MSVERLKAAFVEGLGIPRDSDFESLSYREIPEWDSVAHMQLVNQIELAFDIMLETDDVLAFRHTRPFWPVHIVVVPKRHVPSLIDLGGADEALLHRVLAVVRQVAAQVTREHGRVLAVVRQVAAQVTREHGACRVLTNLGRYQDSKHLHFHVNSGDPLRA